MVITRPVGIVNTTVMFFKKFMFDYEDIVLKDKETIREAINALYKGAGIQATFKGEVNEKVAQVFGELLADINSCSVALKWVP